MAEGLQAGRLDVPVIADLAGFAQKLRTEVEAAAEGLAVKVKIKVDDKGLRKRLEKAVEKASRGVTATIRVKVDQDRLRTELDGVARRVADTDLSLPIRPDGDGEGSPGGGLLGGLRRLLGGAQEEAERNPVHVPVQMRMPRGRGSLRMLGIGALVSLVQPAVAALGLYAGGLTALVSAAAPAVGVLGAIPGLITAAATAAIGTKVAFSGFGDALKESLQAQAKLAEGATLTKGEQQKLEQSLDKLSSSARKSVGVVVELSGAWRKMKQSVQERFFSKIADDIKPLSDSVLPLLQDALGDSASQMGSLAERGAKFMQSGPFRRDFKTIAGTNTRVLGSMTNGLANLGRASLDYLVASGPFVERVGRAGERFTQYVRASAQAGRETGSLARFLDHAGDKAAQLGRSTGSLIRGLGGVGRAAMDSGNAMLDGFEGAMKRFERWANSKPGQKAMQQFFSDAAPAFHEMNQLVGDFARGLGRAFKDGGITDLIRQIRTQLMPAVGSFFNSIGQSIGPAVISVISNIATAIANLSAAGTGLGVLLMAFNGLLHAVNSIMSAVPGANAVLATLLGTMLALKVISGVSGMLRTFGTSVAAAGTSVTSLGGLMRNNLGPGAIGPQATLWARMSGAYRNAATEGGRLSGALRGVGAANRAASTAIGGMMSALGGPLGLAIAGITIGLGILASKQEAAARAAAAHQERINSLAQALAQSNGQIDANVRAQAAAYLQDVKLADGKGKLVDVLRSADVSLKSVTDAYLQQGGTVDGLRDKLMGMAKATEHYVTVGKADVLKMTEEGERYKAAADALGKMGGELDASRRKQQELNTAVNGGANSAATSYDRLSSAVQGFSDKTKGADERVDNLKRALDALSGNTQSFHDATTQLNSAMLQVDDTMKNTIEKTEGWGQALLDSDNMVNTATRNGQTLNGQLTQLRDGMLGVATRAQEAAEQGLMPMSEALSKSQSSMEAARTKAIELAMSMGVPEAQAKALADQMGFIPSTITTLMTTQGIPEATADILSIRGQLENLPPGKQIRVTAPSAEASMQLQTLGFEVQRIPDTKDVNITAPTGTARTNIAALATDIANAPDKKNVTISAIVQQAAGELQGVQDKVASMKGKSIEIQAPTQTAQQALKDLGFNIENVDKGGKTVRITAPTGTALSQVQDIQSKINGLTGKTVNVTIKYSTVGNPYVSPQADGGIVRFAEGGIHQARNRVRAFASGSERHIAQIARPGEWRLWAEPETGGEAYIPLAKSKRRRSEEILNRVATMFGGRVVYFANGALRQYAKGAMTTYSAGRTAGATRTAVPQAAPALVGGDLNLTMTGQPMSPSEALNGALFELRRIRRGGAHVG